MGNIPICTLPKVQIPYKSPPEAELNMKRGLDEGELEGLKDPGY
jgi:hypothetical protein